MKYNYTVETMIKFKNYYLLIIYSHTIVVKYKSIQLVKKAPNNFFF